MFVGTNANLVSGKPDNARITRTKHLNFRTVGKTELP